jgi:hypothetical protein
MRRCTHSHTLYALHSSHALLSYTPLMHSSHALLSCTQSVLCGSVHPEYHQEEEEGTGHLAGKTVLRSHLAVRRIPRYYTHPLTILTTHYNILHYTLTIITIFTIHYTRP